MSFDAGPLGPVYVTGAVSGLGLWQNNKFPDQQHSQASLSNGHVFIQKTEDLFQYYIDVGAYTFPPSWAHRILVPRRPYGRLLRPCADGMGEDRADRQFLHTRRQIAVGDRRRKRLYVPEYAHRGAGPHRAQEPSISRGGQLGYTIEPLALIFSSWNDGFYSNCYTWLSGSATYTLNPANTFVFSAGGNYSQTAKVTTTTSFFQTTATPLFQNNEKNLQPDLYLQFGAMDDYPLLSAYLRPHPALDRRCSLQRRHLAGRSWRTTTLATIPLPGVSLPLRFEYIATTGNAANGRPQSAVRPRQQGVVDNLYTDLSVQDLLCSGGDFSRRNQQHHPWARSFGPNGTNTTQTRGLLEVGILF